MLFRSAANAAASQPTAFVSVCVDPSSLPAGTSAVAIREQVVELLRRNLRQGDELVHESVRVEGSVGRPDGDLEHHPYVDISDHLASIDQMIVAQADNWRLERMAVVDRNIIRMSVYEFLHEGSTPKLVIIDEAIEIAKKYGTQKSSQFINGILDGILKRYNLQGA